MDERVHRVIECIKKNLAPSHWVVGPDSTPPNLLEYLENSEFKRKYTFTCMAINLQGMRKKIKLKDSY